MTQEVLLDVREIPPRERHPKIFKAWQELPVGDAIKLVNDHDPKPLFYEFQAECGGEFKWTVLERGPERWIVEIKRIAAAAGPLARGGDGRPSWAEQAPACVVDVRDDLRAGRDPFQKIMAAAMQARPGDVVEVRAIFEPRPLYRVLGSQGFDAWAEHVGEEDWKVCFHKRP